MRGPDLREPKPLLRIVPAKVSGAPHLLHTRLPSETIAAMARDGVSVSSIQRFYPFADESAIEQAIAFEDEMALNLQRAA